MLLAARDIAVETGHPNLARDRRPGRPPPLLLRHLRLLCHEGVERVDPHAEAHRRTPVRLPHLLARVQAEAALAEALRVARQARVADQPRPAFSGLLDVQGQQLREACGYLLTEILVRDHFQLLHEREFSIRKEK